MDRHKYVKVAYHGFKELSKEEKVAAYGSTLIRDSFDEPDYALIDTLFSLGEAYLFAQLVDFMDNNPGKVPAGTEYDCSLLHVYNFCFFAYCSLVFSFIILSRVNSYLEITITLKLSESCVMNKVYFFLLFICKFVTLVPLETS